MTTIHETAAARLATVAARRKVVEARWSAESRRADARYAVERAEADVLGRVREHMCICDPELSRLRDALLAADAKRRELGHG